MYKRQLQRTNQFLQLVTGYRCYELAGEAVVVVLITNRLFLSQVDDRFAWQGSNFFGGLLRQRSYFVRVGDMFFHRDFVGFDARI